MKDEKREQLLAFCKALGLEEVGLLHARKWEELLPFLQQRKEKGLENPFETEALERRIDPAFYLEGAKTVISIAFPYWDGADVDCTNGFSTYTRRLDFPQVFSRYLV